MVVLTALLASIGGPGFDHQPAAHMFHPSGLGTVADGKRVELPSLEDEFDFSPHCPKKKMFTTGKESDRKHVFENPLTLGDIVVL